MKICHLINPLIPPTGSDLIVAQPITFAAMSFAKQVAGDSVQVELLAACYPEDASVVPAGFLQTQALDRSVLDCNHFDVQRKLPLLKDLLERAYRASDADYIIYTNVDIAPLPHFYTAVATWLTAGFDALVINRRTISDTWQSPEQLPLILSDPGKPHPGFDCFVFPRRWIPDLDVGDICIGVDRIGLVLLAAMHHRATKFLLADDVHLTCHIGDDQHWRNPALSDYYTYNTAQAKAVFERIAREDPGFEARLPSWASTAAAKVMYGAVAQDTDIPAKQGFAVRAAKRLLRPIRRSICSRLC